MYRRLFGVPDVIPDMTRSLEMDQDIKIDILDDHIRTPEVFRVISRKPECRRGYRNPPGKYWALVGLREERGLQPRRWRPPSLLVQFGLGREGARGLPWQPLPLLHIRPTYSP